MDPYLDLGEERGAARWSIASTTRWRRAFRIRAAGHARGGSRPMRDRLTAFLCGWLGGPPRYEERFGHVRMRGAHAPYAIDPALADAWVECMRLALLDARRSIASSARSSRHSRARPACWSTAPTRRRDT
ncbi:MAG: hypothetical protein R3E53_05665 [Myxococcota bacterium]